MKRSTLSVTDQGLLVMWLPTQTLRIIGVAPCGDYLGFLTRINDATVTID